MQCAHRRRGDNQGPDRCNKLTCHTHYLPSKTTRQHEWKKALVISGAPVYKYDDVNIEENGVRLVRTGSLVSLAQVSSPVPKPPPVQFRAASGDRRELSAHVAPGHVSAHVDEAAGPIIELHVEAK